MKMDPYFVGFCFSWFVLLVTACVAVESDCPPHCVCSRNSTILCKDVNVQDWPEVCMEINNFTSQGNTGHDLYLQVFLPNTSLSLDLDCLSSLRSLHVSSTRLNTGPSTFNNLEVLEVLSLCQNKIQDIPDNMFSALGHLRTLNLSMNNISALQYEMFIDLQSLQSLDLSFNNIKTIDPFSFRALTNLTYLNLGHNRIEYITSWHLPISPCLRVLILRDNMLKSLYIGDNDTDSIPLNHVRSLDISLNPLECSCSLQKLMRKVYAQGSTVVNVENTLCNGPSSLKNLSVSHLNETFLHCSKPHSLISFPSKQKPVLFANTITLECRAEAFPSPYIMWITPWGEKFSLAPQSLIVLKDLEAVNQMNVIREYQEENVMMTSTIQVTEKNDLVISGFRGCLAGNFTCVAFNEVGSRQEVILLTIVSGVRSSYLTSLKFASYSASGCLIIGVLIGLINIVVKKLRHKVLFKVPLFTPAASVCPATIMTDSEAMSSLHDDLSPPTSPLLGSVISDRSYTNHFNFDGDSPEKRPHYILDSIGGAKDRLKDGVGRKMESVRRNVQSIKESTGAYVHTIMESGSTAANKMKAGVTMGVETVKYHVQSVKELCGTSHMGTHTVSVISMETDIDTNERKSIVRVRQVTFV